MSNRISNRISNLPDEQSLIEQVSEGMERKVTWTDGVCSTELEVPASISFASYAQSCCYCEPVLDSTEA